MSGSEGKPQYVPAHKLPTWLSSEDVLAAIRELADNGADKAVCWDMTQAVYRLVEKSGSIPVHPTSLATDGIKGLAEIQDGEEKL